MNERGICFPGHERWIAGLALLAGGALGAAVMYYADPDRGRARRRELEKKGTRLAQKAEDLLNRAKAAVVEA